MPSPSLWGFTQALLQAAVSGIASVKVGNPGSGYTSPPAVTIDPPPLGGNQATAIASMGVAQTSVTSGGGGYIYPNIPTATISGGSGSGATATVLLTPFTVGSVVVDTPATTVSYSSVPTVQFSGGNGTGATGTAILSGGEVTQISVQVNGTGYSSVPTVTLAGGGGLGATAIALLDSVGAFGGATVSVNGSKYTSPPAVTVSGAGSPTAAVQFASVLNGSLTSITTNTVQITGGPSPASAGYIGGSSPSFTIGPPDYSIPGASQATASALVPGGFQYGVIGFTILDPGAGYTSPPAIVIATPDVPGPGANQAVGTSAIAGEVDHVVTVYGGAGYTPGTYTLTIAAPPAGGIQAVAAATVSTNSIKTIAITNPGSGYTSAPTVDISLPASGPQATALSSVSIIGVSAVTVTFPGKGYTGPPDVLFIGGGGLGAKAHTVLAHTTVASVVINTEGSGYLTPPACLISGGGGIGATAQTTLCVVGITPSGGYLYGTGTPSVIPGVTIASTDGNGSGATGTAALQTAILAGETFSVAQANVLIAELEALGTLYNAGIPIPVATRAVAYKVPTPVTWSEVDKAARFAASVSAWFPAWPASWAMTPSSDPVTLMTQRAIPLATALAAYAGVPDPFFAEVFSPLYALALPAYAFYVTSQREATTAASSPYADDSPIGLQLAALIVQAEEITTYLETP